MCEDGSRQVAAILLSAGLDPDAVEPAARALLLSLTVDEAEILAAILGHRRRPPRNGG